MLCTQTAAARNEKFSRVHQIRCFQHFYAHAILQIAWNVSNLHSLIIVISWIFFNFIPLSTLLLELSRKKKRARFAHSQDTLNWKHQKSRSSYSCFLSSSSTIFLAISLRSTNVHMPEMPHARLREHDGKRSNHLRYLHLVCFFSLLAHRKKRSMNRFLLHWFANKY